MRTKSALLLTFVLCCASEALALDKIRIGMGAFSPTNSAIWVAEERGFFKKNGIEAEAIFIGGGAARSVNALLAGDIQFATAGGGAVIQSALTSWPKRPVNIAACAGRVHDEVDMVPSKLVPRALIASTLGMVSRA